MIGFVCALEKEADYLIKKFNNLKSTFISNKKVYSGSFANKNCIIIISGVGKVNASISTQILIDKFDIKTIINFGSAGGIINEVQLLNYYVIEKAVQYDFDCSPSPNLKLGQIPDFETEFFACFVPNVNLETKVLATADKFTNKIKDYNLVESFGANIYDMEGAAVCQTAKLNNVKAILIKGISDLSNGNNANDFLNNLETIAKNFPSVIENVLNNI